MDTKSARRIPVDLDGLEIVVDEDGDIQIIARVSRKSTVLDDLVADKAVPPGPRLASVTRLLPVVEAASIAGVSPRWLLRHTRGLAFRKDLSRKNVRFEHDGLMRWLGSRRRAA